MKRFLLPHLICPVCLPKEYRLELSVDREEAGDITIGKLSCPKCRRRFPIRDGVALLLPNPDSVSSGGQLRYEEPGMVDRYLWSHFADLWADPDCGEPNPDWSDCLADQSVSALDAGCSVGRTAFEMAARSGWAVGCDLSLNFIKSARRLARDRHLTFSLPMEGNLRETFRLELPPAWRTDNLDFLVADALRLPFARNTFQQTASLNLLDRISYPMAHLFEMNRVATGHGASFLFASPFSWAVSAAPEELWLGGTAAGPYKGHGLENVSALLTGNGHIIAPPWRISSAGAMTWKMRSHRNHCELIRSEFLIAER